METIRTKRIYKERDPKTKEEFDFPLNYTIKLENKKVVEVINQSGDAVNKNSEVFEYYSQMYNN